MFSALRRQPIRWLTLLVVLEFVALSLGVELAAKLRYIHSVPDFAGFLVGLWYRAAIFAAAMIAGMAALGLYQQHLRENWFGLLARQLVAFLFGSIGLTILYYLVPDLAIGRGVFALALVIGLCAVQGLRLLVDRLIDLKQLKRRVLVLGAGSNAALIPARMRRRTDRLGFLIVGFVRLGDEEVQVPAERLLELDGPLPALVDRLQINEIVVGPDDRRQNLPMMELLDCRQAGIAINTLVSFFERELGLVKLSLVDPSWFVFSKGFDSSPLRAAVKRAFDIAVGLLVLALTWPIMLGVALAIRLESGRGQPILYRQERVGEHGRTFALVKFRSMRTDAERDGVARWAARNDDRVTRVGHVIRRLRFDELPQLWNVLRGDMSVVGPRPERPQFVASLAEKISYYDLRHAVKPGLAGWAQLRYPYGASMDDAVEKLKYDLYYVKNHSLAFDLMILVQTVEVVLFGRGVR